MPSFSPLMPAALIDCVATGRDPTPHELVDLAERVWSEAGRSRSAFAWGDLPSSSLDRAIAMRVACLAFRGTATNATDKRG